MSSRTSAGVDRLRADSFGRWLVTIAAIAIGVVLASVHWAGLFVGGALCGLVSVSFDRALLAGAGFGALVWLVFTAELLLAGSFGAYLLMGQAFAVSVVLPIVAATLAAAVKGLVPN